MTFDKFLLTWQRHLRTGRDTCKIANYILFYMYSNPRVDLDGSQDELILFQYGMKRHLHKETLAEMPLSDSNSCTRTVLIIRFHNNPKKTFAQDTGILKFSFSLRRPIYILKFSLLLS